MKRSVSIATSHNVDGKERDDLVTICVGDGLGMYASGFSFTITVKEARILADLLRETVGNGGHHGD